MLSHREKEFISGKVCNKDWCKGFKKKKREEPWKEPCERCRKKRFRKSKMKNFLSDNFYPLDVTADKFINDFDLLHTYFSSETSWKWHATHRDMPDRKFFKFLKENFNLDKLRTELTLNGTKTVAVDDFLEIKFGLEEIDRLNPLPAPDILVNSLIKKYGEQKIKEAIKRSGL